MRTLAMSLFTFLLLASLGRVAGAAAVDALDEAEQTIVRKLSEDRAYFAWRIKQKKENTAQAEIKRMGKEAFNEEVKRARQLTPVVDYLLTEVEKNREGARISLAKVKSPTYQMLGNYLNLIGTIRARQYARAKVFAERIDLSVGFGKTQSMPEFMDVLTRHLYYMQAMVRYNLHEDEQAVKWFGQISADTEVKAMSLKKKRDLVNTRLADLHKHAIAVAAFDNTTKKEADAWIAPSISEILVNDLTNLTGLKVVERQRMADVLNEIALGQLGVVNEDEAARFGQQLGAGTVVVGTYSVANSTFMVSGRLVHVESGTILASSTKQGSEDTVVATTREMALDLLSRSGILTVSEARKIEASDMPKQAAVKAVAQAKMLMASKPDQARELFEKAMRSDPAYANAFEELRMKFKDVTAQVAIMPFSNTTKKSEDDWMQEGIAESLNADVALLGFSTVERLQLKGLLQFQAQTVAAEQALGADSSGSVDGLTELGNKVAANFMIVGSFQRFADQLKINSRFLDVESGQILWAGSTQGAYTEYAKLLTDLVGQLGKHLNHPIDAAQMAKMVEGKPSIEEFKKFMLTQIAQTDQKVNSGVENREELAKNRLAERVQVKLDEAGKAAELRKWIGAGGVATGAVLATIAQLVAADNRERAGRNYAAAGLSIREEDVNHYNDRGDSFAAKETVWNVVSVAGLGLAAAGAVYWYLTANVEIDLKGVDLTVGNGLGNVSVVPADSGASIYYGGTW